MSRFKLFIKSILYYWKINVASILATALCVAIITGALIIGDSVKYSLNQITWQRLGKTAFVLNAGDKLFRQQLAYDLSDSLHVLTASLLQSQGMASKNGGEILANNVQVNGIDSLFLLFTPENTEPEQLAFDEVFINNKLAQKLQLKPDDYILLKIRKHSDVPLNSPFISTDRHFVSLFARVKRILNDDELGRFSLHNNQVSPYNVFLNIQQLNQLMGQSHAANLVLIEADENINLSRLQRVLKKTWQLRDASLSIRKLDERNQIEILSDQIFINQSIIDGIGEVYENTNIVFTYLVNSIECQEKATPYSFVSAMQSLQLNNKEIILNNWLAKDLSASINDTVLLSYFTVGPLRQLSEETNSFVVKDIIDIEGFASDKTLMPRFPGLANVDNCRDWDAGVSIDLEKIRNKDETYWDEYGGTPKAFIGYDVASKIWGNEFGRATSIRLPSDIIQTDSLSDQILARLEPSELGLHFIPVKEEGLKASNNAIDFSQLFLGMSFFIVVAALLLIGLFFHLNTEYRNKEIGLYLAAGFKNKSIRQILLYEGFIIITLGGVLGIFGAVAYNNILLKAINTVWIDMVKTHILFLKIYPKSLAIGFMSGTICAFLTLYFSIKNKLKKSIVGLQNKIEQAVPIISTGKRNLANVIFYSGIVLILVFTLVYIAGLVREMSLAFFIYGVLLLVVGISGFMKLIKRGGPGLSIYNISFARLCTNNLRKNLKRSLLIVSMLAIGVYLVISTGANRQYMIIDGDQSRSGTGGFRFYAQTTLPIIENLSVPENKLKYGLDNADSIGLEIMQLKTLDGDEASCFNLNQIYRPRLLGIDHKKLALKNAFTFAKTLKEVDKENPWTSLGLSLGENTYPVVADQTVIQWSFGKQLGDTLFFQKENGDTINLVLVGSLQNSIFQGNLLIADSLFGLLYPSVPGSNVFLLEGPKDKSEEIQNVFNRNFRDYGIEMTLATERLASFYSVQNTYLNVFILLGGIGLILGTLGIGILIFRSVLERKKELGILRALGYKKSKILKILLVENSLLLFAGIVIGSVSAVISTLPSFLASGTQIPVSLIALIILVLLLFGWLVVHASVFFSTQQNMLKVLKSE